MPMIAVYIVEDSFDSLIRYTIYELDEITNLLCANELLFNISISLFSLFTDKICSSSETVQTRG